MGSWLTASSAQGAGNGYSSAAPWARVCLFCQFMVFCHERCLATMREMCPVTHVEVHKTSCLDLSLPGQK